jgi:hypothetical protein
LQELGFVWFNRREGNVKGVWRRIFKDGRCGEELLKRGDEIKHNLLY